MKKYNINKEYERYATTMACDIAENVIDSLNNGEYDEIEEAIYDELDTALMFYEDEWEMLKAYCTPQNCDYVKAYNDLAEDIYNLIEEVED